MTTLSSAPGPIGIFDSGYGGLTILHGVRNLLPEYDYMYLGDNARAPYGPRSFDVVYEFTRQAVVRLFELGCHLVILGCTHYPLLMPKIVKFTAPGIRIIPQGEYVAESLKNYLSRHPEMERQCTKHGRVEYLTTENPDKFRESAQIFLHEHVEVRNITLG